MKRLLIAAVLAVALIPGSGASAVTADHKATLTPGQSFSWTGSTQTATNVNYFGNTDPAPVTPVTPIGTCTKDRTSYCEYALIEFSNPVPLSDADGKLSKGATITLNPFSPVPAPVTDFDLLVFESNAAGDKLAELGRDGALDADGETVSFTAKTTRTSPSYFALAEIVYYAVPQSTYAGVAQF